jgi:hypothetical protein
MKKELELQLVEKYPDFFREYGGDPRQTCLAFGIECGDGWYNLIDALCRDLTKLTKNGKKADIIVLQVKQKFAGLRFYFVYEFKKKSIFRKIDSMLREFMFNKRLGKQYWKIVEARRKIWETTYEKVHDRVAKAEHESFKTCELCGNKGKTVGSGWVKTLCEECDKNDTKR